MKLSEALRLGEYALKPVYMKFLVMGADGKPCAGCAVGRACVAAGYDGSESVEQLSRFMDRAWPWTTRFPSGMMNLNTILLRISMKYEAHRSISEIADWVATIEPQDEPAQVASEEEACLYQTA